MKKIVVFIFLGLINTLAIAQVMPEAFVGLLSGIPSDVCSMKHEEREKYLNKVDSLLDLVKTEIQRRKQSDKADNKNSQQQALNNAAQQYGLSPQDMQKIKSGSMTKAQKQAIADKALQNSHNMSFDEAKALSKTKSEGKKAWAEGYSTEVIADQTADPKKTQDLQFKYKSQNELMAMQKNLLDSLDAISIKFEHQKQDIDNEPLAKDLIKSIGELNNEMIGKSNEESDVIRKKIKLKKMTYCNTFSPLFLNILSNETSFTKASIPAIYKLERITNQLTKLQTGADINLQPGSMGLSTVAGFLQSLHEVFKYNIMDAIDEAIDE